MRLIKIALAAFVAFFCLVYAIQNLVNIEAAYGYVALMTSMDGHQAYPDHVGPAVTAPILVGAMLAIIIVLEITAGAFAAKGAFDLWRVRRESAARFDAPKSNALIGTALGVVVWFGIFSAVGGAYFQMWQTELGRGSLRDASMFSLQMAALWLIIYAPDRETVA